MPVFVPVQTAPDALLPGCLALPPPCPAPNKAVPTGAERIEIALPGGTCIRVGADVGLVALRRMMTAVRDAIAREIITLPEQLRQSLTGDQGVRRTSKARVTRSPALQPGPLCFGVKNIMTG